MFFLAFIIVGLIIREFRPVRGAQLPVDARDALSSPSPSPLHTGTRTAHAVIHFDDDVWGSAIFHQWHPDGPVVVSMLFQNIKVSFKLSNLPCIRNFISFDISSSKNGKHC